MAQQYVLSPYQYRTIKKTAIETILPKLVGRQIIPLDPEVGPGTQEVTRTKLLPGDEDAQVIPKGGRYGLTTPTEETETVYIRKIGQGFVVTDEDLESSQVAGRPLDKRSIQIASRKIAEYEDTFIFTGDSRVNEVGLVGAATNTQAVGTKWNLPGCEPYDDANNLVGKMEADGFSPKFAVFNLATLKYLRQEDSYGEIYLDKIVKNLGIPANNILGSGNIAAATALFCESGNDIAQLKEVEALRVMPPIRLPNDTQQINLRERIGLDVYQTDAFGTLTGIV